MNNSTPNVSAILTLVFRAVALAMAVVTIVMSILGTVPVETLVMLLGIGLFALSLDALDKVDRDE